jgi:signal transduction histidine kinase
MRVRKETQWPKIPQAQIASSFSLGRSLKKACRPVRKILFLSVGALACHFVALGVHSTVSMLAFSRQQVFHLRVLNRNDIIRNLLKRLQRIIEIHTDLARDLKPVKADPGQLEQILMNLSVNARDAMPQGGRLTLETRNVVLDENFVREHVGSSPGPQALLTVSDTGTGMDNATLSAFSNRFSPPRSPDKVPGWAWRWFMAW